MKEKFNWLGVLIVATLLCAVGGQVEIGETDRDAEARATEQPSKAPTVFLAILARNTAHTLPYFFSYIDRLDYPKDRMYVW